MSDTVYVEKVNDLYMKVTSESGVKQELMQYFSFRPPGYQFVPSYKNKVWDGYIRLFNPMKPLLYVGLIEYVKMFCEERDYKIEINDDVYSGEDIPDDYGYTIIKEANVNPKYQLRDYQNQYIVNAIKNGRSLSLSPTSSGKSLMQYLIQQHYYLTYRYRTLIIVPTTGLVDQMAGDFIDYGCDPDLIHKIRGGAEKNTKKPIVISTWQSLIRMPKDWFEQFSVVLGDEAHLFQAKSLTSIMEKLCDSKHRHGFTGTISSESKVHKLVLEGLFGSIKKYVSTKDLIDKGSVADFKVKALVLNHNIQAKKDFISNIKKIDKKKKFKYEKEFLLANDKRNIFIRNLVWSLKDQNNLILFDIIEHGRVLEKLLKRDDRIIFFIYGNTPADERERIRHIIENDPEKRYDIIASYGVFSTGVSIKRLDNAIFASGYKSEIKVLQSIGRTLRKGNGSDNAILYDITDDLSVGNFENYTLQHFKKRIDIYSSESFIFNIYNIDLP